MKGSFFSKPLEWNVETEGESWQQGAAIKGSLQVKNHGTDRISLNNAGVGMAHADIKKVHSRTEGILRPIVHQTLKETSIEAGQTLELSFDLRLPPNCPVTDKRSTFFLTYGQGLTENHLQLKIDPLALYGKIVGLLDTFFRFKLKELKGSKNGVEYKLIPPTSREMASLEGLTLTFSMQDDTLVLAFDFLVKKLDTSSITTKLSKESVKVLKEISPRDYSLGREMINQDQLLKILEQTIGQIKVPI